MVLAWGTGITNKPTSSFLQAEMPDALPVAQPTVSKHWREKYHIPWTCLSSDASTPVLFNSKKNQPMPICCACYALHVH